MKNVAIAEPPVELVTISLRILMCITLILFIIGCSSVHVKEHPFAGDPHKPKSIFVFLDGTRNEEKAHTNVWRLYDLISNTSKKDPQTTCIYIEGVGSTDEAEFVETALGALLGYGMEARINKGYTFIAKNYNHGDDIYIFGFSRGAHEARSLAGLLAYAGVPPIMAGDDDKHLMKIANNIIEVTKQTSDKDYLDKWKAWKPGQAPLLSAEIKEEIKRDVRPVEVTFLGVWDTVPGSSLKEFGVCKENENSKEGDRYKSNSYPTIRQIAHAVSIDEKRSKYRPLLLCPKINPENPGKISEVWFPGAHSDVGGGYKDEKKQPIIELPGISLNWMIGLLSEYYKPASDIPNVVENPIGPAHWSISGIASKGSKCEDRKPPMNAEALHSSYFKRISSSPVPLYVNKREWKMLAYPIACPGP